MRAIRPAGTLRGCPCPATAANGSLLVGAGHAPPAGTSLPPETLWIAMDRNPIRKGRIAGHPCGPSGPRHVACPLCPAMAANIPPSVGAGLQGTLAGHPARGALRGHLVPRWTAGGACPAPTNRRTFWAEKNPSAGLMEGRQGDFWRFLAFSFAGESVIDGNGRKRCPAEVLYNPVWQKPYIIRQDRKCRATKPQHANHQLANPHKKSRPSANELAEGRGSCFTQSGVHEHELICRRRRLQRRCP